MSLDKEYIEEEKISFKYLVVNIRDWFFFLWSKKITIAVGAIAIVVLTLAYNYFKKTVYSAQTTFVLESGDGSRLGDLSSVASLAGFNIGGLTEGSDLFQIDNIIELYRSHRMIEKTLLTDVSVDGEQHRLIDLYASDKKLDEKWDRKSYLKDISFHLPRDQFTVRHDSILIELVKDIREKNLFVSKPSRKLTILSVVVNDQNEIWAKKFNEALVINVNQFYLETKTKKTRQNLDILQRQTDSIKNAFDTSLEMLAQLNEDRPNLNPLRQTSQVPIQKLNLDVQTSGLAYTEIVKNLEIARVAHRNNIPLIQIIDHPIFPLEDNKWKTLKTTVIAGFIGGLFMIIFITVRKILISALKD